MSNGIVSSVFCWSWSPLPASDGHSLVEPSLGFQITFKNEVGQYDLEVTTFQLAVLFAWNQRPRERISFENLKLATELPDAELRRTLWVS